MPAFQYFATLDDSVVILRDLCDRGLRIIAEPGPFDEPKAPVFERVTDELVTILRAAPSFYLSGSFTRSPIQFTRSKAAAGTFGIDASIQGPVLQGLVGQLVVLDGKSTLLPADISYRSHYRNPTTNQLEPASRDLLAAYTLAMLTIRNRCTRASVEIFVAPAALGLIQRREVVLAGQ